MTIKIREWVHANICVRDLSTTIPFYEMLGFEKVATTKPVKKSSHPLHGEPEASLA